MCVRACVYVYMCGRVRVCVCVCVCVCACLKGMRGGACCSSVCAYVFVRLVMQARHYAEGEVGVD